MSRYSERDALKAQRDEALALHEKGFDAAVAAHRAEIDALKARVAAAEDEATAHFTAWQQRGHALDEFAMRAESAEDSVKTLKARVAELEATPAGIAYVAGRSAGFRLAESAEAKHQKAVAETASILLLVRSLGVSVKPTDDGERWRGENVAAEKAEARVKELESERNALVRLGQRTTARANDAEAELVAARAERDGLRAALKRADVLGVLEFFSRSGNPQRPQGGEQFPNRECCEIARDAVKSILAAVPAPAAEPKQESGYECVHRIPWAHRCIECEALQAAAKCQKCGLATGLHSFPGGGVAVCPDPQERQVLATDAALRSSCPDCSVTGGATLKQRLRFAWWKGRDCAMSNPSMRAPDVEATCEADLSALVKGAAK